MVLLHHRTLLIKRALCNSFVKRRAFCRQHIVEYQMDGGGNSNSSGISSNDNYDWCPGSIISGGKGRHACLVLNTPIRLPAHVAHDVWTNAQIRCTVDGGANRWRHFLRTNCQRSDDTEAETAASLPPPDLITGDFDSITEESRAYFNDSKTRWVCTPDQNATDFTKAVGVVRPLLANKQLNDIIVFHDTSGRLDQIMANLNTLFKVQTASLNVYLLSGNSMTWLLRPGRHSISIPPELVTQQRWCALIPVGERADCVTTTGLKWNLKNSVMEFGHLVSTSNTYAAEHVQIETSSCLIWSMGVFSFDDDD